MSGRTLLLVVWIGAASLGAVRTRAAGAQETERPQTARTLWQAANRAATAGRPDEYRRLLASAVALAPQHPGVLYLLARADALTGRTAEALSLLERLAAMGFAGFDAADTAFGSLAVRPTFLRAAARFTENRQPVIASDTAFTVAGPDRIPENIAFDPRSGAFFVGSMAERTIVRLRPNELPQLFAGPADGLLRVVGMKVDTRRGRLWVATWAPVLDSVRHAAGVESDARLFAFDIASGRRLLMLSPRDTTRSHSFNDVVVTSVGDVLVTDNAEASVYRVRTGVDTLELLTRPDPTRFNRAKGITLSADGARLYVAFAEGIARVDPVSGRTRYLTVPPTVTTSSVDGLYWHDGDLVTVQMAASVERVVRFVLDPSGWRVRRADVLERVHPAFRYPTTGVVIGDTLYYVANPEWDRLEDDGTVRLAEVAAPTIILRLPLHRVAVPDRRSEDAPPALPPRATSSVSSPRGDEMPARIGGTLTTDAVSCAARPTGRRAGNSTQYAFTGDPRLSMALERVQRAGGAVRRPVDANLDGRPADSADPDGGPAFAGRRVYVDTRVHGLSRNKVAGVGHDAP